MKKRDLNENNLVSTKNSDNVLTIEFFRDDRIFVKESYFGFSISDIEPIKLNTFWFEKLGFLTEIVEPNIEYWTLSHGNTKISIQKGTFDSFLVQCAVDVNLSVKIKHVHEVQNLFYVLEKKELITNN